MRLGIVLSLLILLVSVLAVSIRFSGPIRYEVHEGLTQEEADCGIGFAHVTFDNPIESALLSRVKISRPGGDELVAVGYLIGGIRYSTIVVASDCNSASRL